MPSMVLIHRDEEDDAKVVLLTLTLQMNPREPGDVVDPSHPILPLEDIDRVFGESEKRRKVFRDGLSPTEDARRWVCAGYDLHDLGIEKIAGGGDISCKSLLEELFGHRDAGIGHESHPSTLQ
jgi:hypothetical protein